MRRIRDQAAGALRANRKGPPVSNDAIAAITIVGMLAAILAGVAARKKPAKPRTDPVEHCAQRLNTGAAMLAGSVLADSALEHFRGNYDNRAMYVAPTMGACSLAAALSRGAVRPLAAPLFAASTVTGAAGIGFHLYNIMKRPGGLSWNNLFYAAPFAAPGALTLAGVLGLAGERLDGLRRRRPSPARMRQFGSGLALVLSGGILATVAEVALLHFRGAYHNPLMYAPVTVPPLAAASLVAAAVQPSERTVRRSRWLLRITALLGLIGVGFHVIGVQRNMGGWRNWTQNLFQGPPLPAPPSFTGLALAGLGALRLLNHKGR